MIDFPLQRLRVSKKEALPGVSTGWKGDCRGKSPPTPFQNMVSVAGDDLPVLLQKCMDWLEKQNPSGVDHIWAPEM